MLVVNVAGSFYFLVLLLVEKLCFASVASDPFPSDTLRPIDRRSWTYLRATLSKILIPNFHPEIDFAHNSSINFTWQLGKKYEIISEKLNFFKIF